MGNDQKFYTLITSLLCITLMSIALIIRSCAIESNAFRVPETTRDYK